MELSQLSNNREVIDFLLYSGTYSHQGALRLLCGPQLKPCIWTACIKKLLSKDIQLWEWPQTAANGSRWLHVSHSRGLMRLRPMQHTAASVQILIFVHSQITVTVSATMQIPVLMLTFLSINNYLNSSKSSH